MMVRSVQLSLCGVVLLGVSACGTMETAAPVTPVLHPTIAHERVFQTPEAAVDALVTAARNEQREELVQILGPKGKKLVYSGDKVADQNGRSRFAASFDAEHSLEQQKDGSYTLIVGEHEWPMPIPLVPVKGGWQWDTDAGDDEIINRRIGRNELSVIEVCRSYVEAQQEYGEMHPVGHHGRHIYAQHLISEKGKRDGLYWPVRDGEKESPLGPLIAKARAEGYDGKERKSIPYHGYYYKILREQGPHAPEGAESYINKHGHMTRGFALIAIPARYGNSGIMTFIVNDDGIVYQKNLGRNTDKIVREITAYDPDKSWTVVE